VQRHHEQPTTTVAILGADTVVGRALCALLESNGYRTTPIASYTTGVVDDLLEGAHLLLLAPRLDPGVREAFLAGMGKSTPQRAHIPVIALTTAVEEDLPEKEGVISVPWPCETKVLVERIEAALSTSAASTTSNDSTTQSRTG
jgi:FixJ family two-component response regulator